MDTLGIDLAKDSFEALLLDEHGGLIHDKSRSFTYTRQGFRKLLEWLRDPANTRVIVEPTGVCGKRLLKALDGLVAGIYEVNARLLKRLGLSMVQTKTDPADARGIAEAGFLLGSRRPKRLEEFRASYDGLREATAVWLGEYDRLRREISRLRCQIQDLRLNPAPVAKIVLARRTEELERLLTTQAEVKSELQQAFEAWAPEEAALLTSITGIGPLTAVALLLSIRSIDRFESSEALKGFLGCYPRRFQTGHSERPTHMPNHGPALVRHMLWNAAKSAARFNPSCRDLFERLVARGKTKPAAWGAVMRKLTQIVYGVLRSRRPFAPEFP